MFYSSFIHYPLFLSFFFDTHAIYSYYRHSRSFCLWNACRESVKPEGATNQDENCLDTPSYRSSLRAERLVDAYLGTSMPQTRTHEGIPWVRVSLPRAGSGPERPDFFFTDKQTTSTLCAVDIVTVACWFTTHSTHTWVTTDSRHIASWRWQCIIVSWEQGSESLVFTGARYRGFHKVPVL